jgi:hypothetical protein
LSDSLVMLSSKPAHFRGNGNGIVRVRRSGNMSDNVRGIGLDLSRLPRTIPDIKPARNPRFDLRSGVLSVIVYRHLRTSADAG